MLVLIICKTGALHLNLDLGQILWNNNDGDDNNDDVKYFLWLLSQTWAKRQRVYFFFTIISDSITCWKGTQHVHWPEKFGSSVTTASSNTLYNGISSLSSLRRLSGCGTLMAKILKIYSHGTSPLRRILSVIFNHVVRSKRFFKSTSQCKKKSLLWLIYNAWDRLGYGYGLRLLPCTEIGSRDPSLSPCNVKCSA